MTCFCSSGRQAARLFSVPHVVQQETTLAYLENQVAAALILQSSHEYRHWLLLYARYLVNEGEVPGGSSILLGPAQSLPQHNPSKSLCVRPELQWPRAPYILFSQSAMVTQEALASSSLST